jgi:hypothetical protein
MSASYGILGSHGASACTLPDPADAVCTARRCPGSDVALYPGDVAVRYGERYFASYHALALWMLDNKQAQHVTLPNHRCEMCDSDGCRVMFRGRIFCDVGCFAEWLEENGEAEWDVVPDDREECVGW